MPRPNAGGGRYNQNNNDAGVPRRAMFSFSASGKGGGKGDGKGKGGKGEKGEKGKGKRPVFESQKELDKWKGQQKGQAAASQPAQAAAKGQAAGQPAKQSLWPKIEPPSYTHGIFALTRDDHMALEPLLNPAAASADLQGEKLPPDVEEDAADFLRELGLLMQRIRPALQVVAPQLLWEAEETGSAVSARAAAERALEWICSVTPEKELPARLKEAHEVTAFRRKQEERNVTFQTKALLLGGGVDSNHIARIEKLGFSRAKAIEALANAPDHDLLTAVKGLLAGYLPLELEQTGEDIVVSSPDDLKEETEALQGAYGEKEVQGYYNFGNFEVAVEVPGTQWELAVLIPETLPYPSVSPLLCPKHPRLREAGRPRLLGALGDVCRESLGVPMLFILCEWLLSEGERFLVRSDEEGPEASRQAAGASGASSHVERSLEASAQQKAKEEEEAKAKESRVAFLKSLQAEEETSKLKDKIAIQIRSDPDEASQYDLAGYDDARVKELVREAFGSPLEGDHMVRITFVIGGGKLVRQKYSESLGKVLGSALQDLGFQQDSTASSTWESAGTFKGQHDTQKNLKLVHVFPRMTKPAAAGQSGGEEAADVAYRRLAMSEWDDFSQEVAAWVRSRELRPRAEGLLAYLRSTGEELQDVDERLQNGQPVSESKRKNYDELVGAEDLEERASWLTKQLRPRQRDSPGDGPDGSTLSFEAPAELTERLASSAAPNAEAAAPKQEEDDVAWLRRRVQQVERENQRLQTDFKRSKPLDEVRHGLPAWTLRDDIQRAVRENQVIVVQGETGCGKSTQVPQFILEDWVARGEGGAVNLLMTQPRRISAIGVAERIASEMDSSIGDLAGYSIRLESKKSARTKILVCTTGVVLRRLEADRSLRGVTHIVVDECHERDLDTDFLLIVLKEILPSRPALKVVLMSATINAQIFCDYFDKCHSIKIPGRTFPVTPYFLEHALQQTHFVVEPDSEFTRKDAAPLEHHEKMELQQLYEKAEYQELIQGPVSPFVMEQINRMDPERINFDLVAAVVRHIHANVDPPSRGKSPGAILVFVPGFGEIKRCIRSLVDEDPFQSKGYGKGGKGGGSGGGTGGGLWVLPLHSMVSVADQRLVFKKPEKGLRKVVVTTNIAETSITIDDVEYVVDCCRHKQTKYDPQNRVSMLVDCSETKANAKQRRGRAGRVKAGVCYHLVNVRKWRRLEDFEKPEMLRVPLDSLCLRISLLGLGHPAKFLAKALTPPTEAAVRSSLQQLVELSAVELSQQRRTPLEEQMDNAEAAAAEKEDQERLMKAKLRLTPLGAHLAQLPVDAGMGKLLVLGCLFGIPEDVCVLAAALTTKSPFQASMADSRKEGEKRRVELSSGYSDGTLESDHLLLVSLFEKWEALVPKSQACRNWCRQNGLDNQTFETVSDTRTHLHGVLVEQGFIARRPEEKKGGKGARSAGSNWMPPCLATIASAKEEFERRKRQLLRSLLCAALWPNVVLRRPGGQLTAKHQAALTFHPSSILGLQDSLAAEVQNGDWNCPSCGFFCFAHREVCPNCGTDKPPPQKQQKDARPLRHRAFVYGEKVRSVGNPGSGKKPQVHVKDCCGVSVKSLFLLGHRVGVDYLSGRASVDGWVHCHAAPRDMAMVLGLRRRLQEVLSKLLTSNPADGPDGKAPEVIDAATAMLVLDVE